MESQKLFKAVMCSTLIVMVILSAQVRAQPSSSRGRGIYGDWNVKVDYGEGRQFESILSFSRDQEGNLTGSWISFMGINELQDLKYEEGQISFSRTRRNRDGETTTSNFKGTIEDDKISGTWSSERGDLKLEGKRAPRMSRAVGIWEMTLKREDREFTSTLTIKVDKEGQLMGQWRSERGELAISDVQYERGNVSFKMERKSEERQWQASFEGAIDRQTGMLSGVIKSERGEMKAEGKRVGTPLIGTWNLESTSERGTRKQRLLVNPDMSGLYGSMAIKKVEFEDGKVSFKIVMEFGDQTFEINFTGKIEDSKLIGEITSDRGSQKITGTKVIRRFRRRNTG